MRREHEIARFIGERNGFSEKSNGRTMIGDKIKSLRRERGITLEELAVAIGTSKQTIHRYETGTISNIPPEKVVAMAEALGTTPSELMGWNVPEDMASYGTSSVKIKRLPILGAISCGVPIYAEEEHESYAVAEGGVNADFCLRASGDSMIGARIFDGDIVFIRSQSEVNNGEIAAVIINDEATLKRVYYYPGEQKLILSPENPRFAPLVYLGEELASVKIIGKAVAFQSRIS